MKNAILALTLIVLTLVRGWSSEVDSAAKYYMRYGHDENDTLLYAEVELNGPGAKYFLVTYEKAGYQNNEAWTWAVLKNNRGNWEEVGSMDSEGVTHNFSALWFDYRNGGLVFMKQFGHKGFLSNGKGTWAFVYLEGSLLRTEFFSPKDIGMTANELKKLAKANPISIGRRAVPN